MSRRPVARLVQDILERIQRIEDYVAGHKQGAFLADRKTSDAVIRNMEVIGEAAARLPAAFREAHSDIPWARIIGLRNRVVHEYFDVDLELVWQIVRAELPELKVRLLALPPWPDDKSL